MGYIGGYNPTDPNLLLTSWDIQVYPIGFLGHREFLEVIGPSKSRIPHLPKPWRKTGCLHQGNSAHTAQLPCIGFLCKLFFLALPFGGRKVMYLDHGVIGILIMVYYTIPIYAGSISIPYITQPTRFFFIAHLSYMSYIVSLPSLPSPESSKNMSRFLIICGKPMQT